MGIWFFATVQTEMVRVNRQEIENTMFSGWSDFLGKGFQYFFAPLEFPSHFFKIIRLTFSQRSLIRELIHLKPHRDWFASHAFNTIIDIGANTGPFSFAMRLLSPESQIFAFEPLSHCYAKLVKNLDPMGKFTAFQTAIGDKQVEVEMWQSEFSESSSLLPMGDLHKQAFPHTADAQLVNVPLAPLDDYLDKIEFNPPVLLKIDVQGYEDKVIRGASKTLKHVDWIITELSFRTLYEGQPLFAEMYQLITSYGFRYAGNFDVLISPTDGSILQMDGMFYREK